MDGRLYAQGREASAISSVMGREEAGGRGQVANAFGHSLV